MSDVPVKSISRSFGALAGFSGFASASTCFPVIESGITNLTNSLFLGSLTGAATIPLVTAAVYYGVSRFTTRMLSSPPAAPPSSLRPHA